VFFYHDKSANKLTHDNPVNPEFEWKFWVGKNSLVGEQVQTTTDLHFKVQMNNLQRSNMFLGGQEELKNTYPFSYIAVLQNTL